MKETQKHSALIRNEIIKEIEATNDYIKELEIRLDNIISNTDWEKSSTTIESYERKLAHEYGYRTGLEFILEILDNQK